jgi:hypothetical protein
MMIMLFSLCFSFFIFQTIKVDVTELLLNDTDSQTDDVNPDDNGNPNRLSDDERYESLSSARPSLSGDEAKDPPSLSIDELNIDDNHTIVNAASDIQDDLNNLAAVIHAELQASSTQQEHLDVHAQKLTGADEDDDTSKQASKHYDINEVSFMFIHVKINTNIEEVLYR